MPNVVDAHGVIVFRGQSDAGCVRWWHREGMDDDRLEDTGELMSDVARQLSLDNY